MWKVVFCLQQSGVQVFQSPFEDSDVERLDPKEPRVKRVGRPPFSRGPTMITRQRVSGTY